MATMVDIASRLRDFFAGALVEGDVTVVLCCANEGDKYRLQAAILHEFTNFITSQPVKATPESGDRFRIAGTEFILRTLDQR